MCSWNSKSASGVHLRSGWRGSGCAVVLVQRFLEFMIKVFLLSGQCPASQQISRCLHMVFLDPNPDAGVDDMHIWAVDRDIYMPHHALELASCNLSVVVS